MSEEQRLRATDKGFWCTVALRFSQMWDFIDNRDIDKHLMAWASFAVTVYMVFWCLEYAWSHADKSGVDLGLTIAALLAPWTPVQGAVVKWYFSARTDP